MRDECLVSSNEPFKNLLTQGMVVADTYYRTLENGGKDWFNPADVIVERDAKAKIIGAKLARSEEHTSELQSLMRISYAVFCLKNKKNNTSIRLTANTQNRESKQKNKR